jgi:predicted nucleic acid-binding protein
MTSLPTGSAWVCFDTTALIHFNAIGELDTLGAWFPRAFAPSVVIEEEIRNHLANYPKNQAILDASWLEAATVTEPPALKDVADIHKRYGRRAGQDRGEAEVVVLCASQGWTGIIDDSNGQKAARDYNAPYCSILTMILAAAGHGLIEADRAWKLHADLDASRGLGRSALTAGAVHRPPFQACIKQFAQIVERRRLDWPHILGTPGVDGLVIRIRNQTP